MNLLKKILLPLGSVALVGACAPYPSENASSQTQILFRGQKTIADEEQRQLDESRRRLAEQEAWVRRNNDARGNGSPTTVKPAKPKYPTAFAVPGKEGFVFNPYTHNIVNVKGIASGKLCRDPDDSDESHKFRVP